MNTKQTLSNINFLNKFEKQIDLKSVKKVYNYSADVISYSDYYPFGMLMPNRYTGNSKYRYSFNGMEKDNEIAGDGNSFSTQFRQYDPRIARWTSIDPVTHEHMSPYNAFDGNPIYFADPSGADSEGGGNPDDFLDDGGSQGGDLTPDSYTFSLGYVWGSHHKGLTFNGSNYNSFGNWNLQEGVGVTYYFDYQGSGSGFEFRFSLKGGFNDGNTDVGLGTNLWRGTSYMKGFSQRTGMFSLNIRNKVLNDNTFSLVYENDGYPFGEIGLSDNNDSYRTAAGLIGFGGVEVYFGLSTGARTDFDDKNEMKKGSQSGDFGATMPHGYVKETGPQYRVGIAAIRYKGIHIGVDSDLYIRHPIQNIVAHHLLKPQPGFSILSNVITPYYQFNMNVINMNSNSNKNIFRNFMNMPSTPRFSLYQKNAF